MFFLPIWWQLPPVARTLSDFLCKLVLYLERESCKREITLNRLDACNNTGHHIFISNRKFCDHLWYGHYVCNVLEHSTCESVCPMIPNCILWISNGTFFRLSVVCYKYTGNLYDLLAILDLWTFPQFSDFSVFWQPCRNTGSVEITWLAYTILIIRRAEALRTTIVPIRILIRTTVVPIRILIRTTEMWLTIWSV